MTDGQTRILFLVIYAALMFGAYKVLSWIVHALPEQVVYVLAPAIWVPCLLGVVYYEWRKRWRGGTKG